MKRKFSLVVVISLIVSDVMAQNAGLTLRGAVGDAFKGSPIIGATVMVPASNQL